MYYIQSDTVDQQDEEMMYAIIVDWFILLCVVILFDSVSRFFNHAIFANLHRLGKFKLIY